MERLVYVVVDTLGAGRVLGVFSNRDRAVAVAATNPRYYVMTACRLNELTDKALAWAQSDEIREALEKAASS